jgi:hypothetical protein
MPLYTQPKSESVSKKSHDPHQWKMTPPVENDRRPPSVEMRSHTPAVEMRSIEEIKSQDFYGLN